MAVDPEAGEEEEAPKGPAKASSVEDALEIASERVRQTAKWLAGSFGAIATALIAGVQLADIGQLEGSDRVLALGGVIVAIAAAILIVFFACLVLAHGRIPLSDLSSRGGTARRSKLVRKLSESPGLYAPFNSVGEFADAVSDEWIKQSRSWWRAERSPEGADKDAALREFREAQRALTGLNKINTRLMASARWEDLRITFSWVSRASVGLAVVAAIGAGVFLFVNSVAEPTEGGEALAQRPSTALADFTDLAKERLEDGLGKDCDLDRVPVVALESSDDGWEVVSLPIDGCEEVRFSIDQGEASLTPVTTVDLEL